MKIITATQAQNNVGDLLMDAQSEPISITRNGKVKGVLVSSADYQKMKHQALQNAISRGIENGKPATLDMNEIKRKAREKTGLNIGN